MVDLQQIINGFGNMIGVSQTPEDLPIIDADLLVSTHGKYLHDIHPYFEHNTLFQLPKELDLFAQKTLQVRAYSTGTYQRKDLVSDSGKIYRSLVDNNAAALTDTNSWAETNLYSNYIRRKIERAISSAISGVISKKMSVGTESRSILNNIQIYDGRGLDPITNYGRFVGWKIKVKKANLKFVTHKISIQLSQAQTLPIYIYKGDDIEPTVINVDYTTPYKMQEFEIDATFISGISNAEVRIGYYQDDLVGEAIKRAVKYDNCLFCGDITYSYFQKYNPYVLFNTFHVDSSFLNVERTFGWYEEDEVTLVETNYGMNIHFSVLCDVTELILSQKSVFQELIEQSVKVEFLNDILNSLRDNETANMVRGWSLNNGGVAAIMKTEKDRLDKRINDVAFDITGLDSVCFRSENARRKIRMGAV